MTDSAHIAQIQLEIRDALAQHGTEDPEIYGTARHGKSWHGKSWHGTARKILARKNIGTAWHPKSCQMDPSQKIPGIFEQIQILTIIYLNFQIFGKYVLIRRETIFPKVVRLEK